MLEKEMATHSRILAWRIPWTKEPGGLQSKESDTTERLTHTHTHTKSAYFKNLSTYTVKFLFQFSSAQSLSRVQLFATSWTVQSMEFSRPES